MCDARTRAHAHKHTHTYTHTHAHAHTTTNAAAQCEDILMFLKHLISRFWTCVLSSCGKFERKCRKRF